MTARPDDFLVQAWKQQLDIGLRMTEILVEGATKLREMQLEAAADAHADIEATRKSIALTSDVSRLLELQAQWTRANAQKCADYWRNLYDLAARTQAELAVCLSARPAQAASVKDPKEALLALVDRAYKQWFDATQQLYKLPAVPVMPRPEKPEKRAAA